MLCGCNVSGTCWVGCSSAASLLWIYWNTCDTEKRVPIFPNIQRVSKYRRLVYLPCSSGKICYSDKTFFCGSKSGSLQFGPVSQSASAMAQEQVFEVEPWCILSHIRVYLFRTTSALCPVVAVSSCGFLISGRDSWADAYSYLWLLTLGLTFWFLVFGHEHSVHFPVLDTGPNLWAG